MSADFTSWHIVDKDGNQLDLTDVLLNHGAVIVEATEYDPEMSAFEALRQALDHRKLGPPL